jgi:hypothetical protein
MRERATLFGSNSESSVYIAVHGQITRAGFVHPGVDAKGAENGAMTRISVHPLFKDQLWKCLVTFAAPSSTWKMAAT